tara:strand:- start:486 stop:908 length:423 start_codon:yes stop_codon:yes gene_type:complete
MKHYRNNHSFKNKKKTPERDSKRNKYNLNSSESTSESIDIHINKWLSYSDKFLAPFFEDEEFKNSYVNKLHTAKIDEGIDNAVPSWLRSIIDSIKKVSLILFSKKNKLSKKKIRRSTFKTVSKSDEKIITNTFKKIYQSR